MEWVQNSSWPVSFSELYPYYKAADVFMDIDTMNYSTDIFPKIKLDNPGIFPTGSHSNPALTMLALGLRLTDHLTLKKHEQITRDEVLSLSE